MNDIELDLVGLQEIYGKARFLLLEFGEKDDSSAVFRSERIEIRGSTENMMLSIWFDSRENTKSNTPSTALIVDSRGRLREYSEPHLSEKEAKMGRKRKSVYLPWTNWLNKAYQEGKRKYDVLQQKAKLLEATSQGCFRIHEAKV